MNILIQKRVVIISCFIVLLTLLVSSVGVFLSIEGNIDTFKSIFGEEVELFNKGLYKFESKGFGLQLVAQDLVNIFIGIPLLIIGLILFLKRSLKGYFILTGTVGYFLYTFITYSFICKYNYFFLIYVALMSLCFFNFIFLIKRGEGFNFSNNFKTETPVKFYGVLQIVMSVLFALMWLKRILPSLTGDFSGLQLEHYNTLGIQAIDIGFVIPVSIYSGVLIFKRREIGYLLTSIMLFKLTTLFIAVVAMVIVQHLGGVEQSLYESIIFILVSILFSGCFISLLSNIKKIKK